MTIAHMEKLDALKLEKFFIECSKNLKYIRGIENDIKNDEQFIYFVKHVYAIATKYKINNKKDIFSLILLWYVEGDSITKDKEFEEILTSETLYGYEKGEYFKNRALEKIEGMSK